MEGTPGAALALFAAFLNAMFGALQKGRRDSWISRMAIDASYGIMAPFVLPWPDPGQW